MADGVWEFPFTPETLDKHVCIAFATRGNDLYWKTVLFMLNQTNVFKKLTVYTCINLWGTGAEQLFASLADYPCDYVLIIDSDVAPTVDTPVRLIERGVDIVAAPTVMYDGANQDLHFNVHLDESMARVYSPKPKGLQKVFNTSWACVMISHRVLEMFKQAGETFTRWSPLIPERWKELPPDSMFYEKAKALGFDLWMDWDLEYATHHKYVALDAYTLEKWIKNRIFAIDEREETGRALHVLGGRRAIVTPRQLSR